MPYKIGQTVIFNGYSELAPGQEEIINSGERVVVVKYDEANDTYVIRSADRTDESGEALADSAFEDELQATGLAEDEAVEKPKKGKPAKAKKKAVAEPAEDVEPLDVDPDLEGETNAEIVEEDDQEDEVIVPKKKKKLNKALIVKEDKAVADQMVDDTIHEHHDAIAAAKALIERSEQTYLMLGGVLHHIYENNLHKAEGYAGKRGFQEFVAKELGIEYRKAMYLMSNYRVFRELSLDAERNEKLMAMGWSKAKEIAAIARLRDPETNEEYGVAAVEAHFDELADYAVEKTRDELTAKIKSDFVDMREGERIAITKFAFKLVGEAGETCKRAIQHAKSQMPEESASDSMAFEVVCGEYINMTEGTEQTLEEAIALVENRFGIKLVVQEGTQVEA